MRIVELRVLTTSLALIGSLGNSAPAQNREAIEVRVDPRVELLSIVFRLAGNPEYNQSADYTYAHDVDRHFRLFKDHPAVLAARALRNEHGVSFDAVMSMAIHLDDPPALSERIPFDHPPKNLDRRWPVDGARAFLEQLRAFVKDSGFEQFTQRHRAFHDLAATRLRERLEQRDYLSWFDAFFGARPSARFIAIPGLLNGGQGYGPSVRFPDGREELCMVLGVWKTDLLGGPVFDDGIVSTVVHEFCHSYVNAVVDAFADDLEASGTKIWPHVAERMKRQAYGEWRTMMREACVRACVARYVLEADGADAARREVLDQHRRGFAWTGELVEVLARYQADRTRYPTFDAFFPEVVRFFDEYAEGNLETLLAPTVGPINSVFSQYRSADKLILAAPEGIADKGIADKVSTDLDAVHKQFYEKAGVKMSNAGRLSRGDLKRHAVVAYGSPDSNKVIRVVVERYGIVLAADHVIVGGKKFDGADLVLIACVPSPYAPDKPVLIYAAHDDRHVISANDFFHGPTDYVVGRWDADRAIVVHAGNFERDPSGGLTAD